MANINTNSAAAASAALASEPRRPQVQAAAETSRSVPVQSVALNQGEQVQLETYTVKKGDTLWDIAGVKLGDPYQWPKLYALNQDQIKNPDLIHPGQILTLPKQINIAPTTPPPNLPSPVDVTPPPAMAPPVSNDDSPVVIPVADAPVQPTPAPQAPTSPIAEAPPQAPVQADPSPIAETPAPTAPSAPLLRPPSELPSPRPEDPNIYPPGGGVISPPGQQPIDLSPNTPVDAPQAAEPEPTAPVEQPSKTPLASIGQPTAKSNGVAKAALIGGAIGTIGAGAALITITKTLASPVSRLGGYATAQVVAKSVNAVTSKVGFKVPAGPALSKIVSKVGGPKMAGTVTAVGVGLAVAGLAAGGYYLYKKASDNDDSTPAPAQVAPGKGTPTPAATTQQPQVSAPTASVSPAPAEGDAATAIANLQPVIENNGRPPVDVASKHQELESLLNDKKYYFFGGTNQPDQARATGVQIWLDGNLDDRVRLANTLVSNGQAEVLGRIMSHEETTALDVTELMSQPQFPVSDFMNKLDDNQAFIVLNSLSSVAAMGEPKSAQVIGKIVESYDGTFTDREGPFKQLRQFHQSQNSWEALPANLRQQIDKLLK